MITAAIAAAGERRVQLLAHQDDAREATWRERATASSHKITEAIASAAACR